MANCGFDSCWLFSWPELVVAKPSSEAHGRTLLLLVPATVSGETSEGGSSAGSNRDGPVESSFEEDANLDVPQNCPVGTFYKETYFAAG